MDTFGQRVRRARTEARLSQLELAERAGISNTTISRWEREAEEEPTRAAMTAVARVLQTSVEWLKEGGSERPPIVVQAGVARAEARSVPATVREVAGYGITTFTARAREILEEIQRLHLELARELRALESAPATSPPEVPLERTMEILSEVEKVVPPPQPARQRSRKRA